MKEHASILNGQSRNKVMETTNETPELNLVARLTIKGILLGLLVLIIGVAIYSWYNPQWFLNGLISMIPILMIGLVVITIAGKFLKIIS